MKLKRLRSYSGFDRFRKDILRKRQPDRRVVSVCKGTGCQACGSVGVDEAFEKKIAKRRLAAQVEIKGTGCHGFCEKDSLVVIHPEEILYTQVMPKDVADPRREESAGGSA